MAAALGAGPPLPIPPALPIGLVQGALVGGVVGGVAASRAVRAAWGYATASRRRGLFLVRRPDRRRRCPRCAGFRITACDLCAAQGLCDYRKRYKRVIPCPRCVLRRFVRCPVCAGSGLRERGFVRRAFAWVQVVLAPVIDALLDAAPFGEQAAGGLLGAGGVALGRRPVAREVTRRGAGEGVGEVGGEKVLWEPSEVPASIAPLFLAMLGHRIKLAGRAEQNR